MKKLAILFAATLVLTSCGSTNSLYYWGGAYGQTSMYEELAYKHYDKQTPQSICALICTYEDMVSHPGGTRRVPPPGICAEYAYLISQPEVVTIFVNNATSKQKSVFGTDNFNEFFSKRAEEMFEKEMELYPESITFIKPIFEKIKNR